MGCFYSCYNYLTHIKKLLRKEVELQPKTEFEISLQKPKLNSVCCFTRLEYKKRYFYPFGSRSYHSKLGNYCKKKKFLHKKELGSDPFSRLTGRKEGKSRTIYRTHLKITKMWHTREWSSPIYIILGRSQV